MQERESGLDERAELVRALERRLGGGGVTLAQTQHTELVRGEPDMTEVEAHRLFACRSRLGLRALPVTRRREHRREVRPAISRQTRAAARLLDRLGPLVRASIVHLVET